MTTTFLESVLRVPAPKVTGNLLSAVLLQTTAVIVQNDHGDTYALPVLTAEQADDPGIVVLIDHRTALDYVAGSGGRVHAAAKRVTQELAGQHALGLL